MKKFLLKKPEPKIEKEKITDDQGREIDFKRPNGDKLKNHFVKISAKDKDDNIALKLKQLKAKKKRDKLVV